MEDHANSDRVPIGFLLIIIREHVPVLYKKPKSKITQPLLVRFCSNLNTAQGSYQRVQHQCKKSDIPTQFSERCYCSCVRVTSKPGIHRFSNMVRDTNKCSRILPQKRLPVWQVSRFSLWCALFLVWVPQKWIFKKITASFTRKPKIHLFSNMVRDTNKSARILS